MSKAVVEMLHTWWRRLAETELSTELTREDLLHLLDLPAPGETVALNQIGLARVDISASVRSLHVCFLEPLVFEDVVAVFGRGSPGVICPDSFSERPHCYYGDHFGAASFVFTVRSEKIVIKTEGSRWIDVCHNLQIRLAFRPQASLAPKRPIAAPVPLAPIVTPPVGRFRLWLRRLRSR